MKTKLIALLFSFVSLSAFAGTNIINGTLVAANDPLAKMTVAIHSKNTNGEWGACTGVLITRNVVLTAAHCVINEKTRTWITDRDIKVVFDVNAFELENINPKAITRDVTHMQAPTAYLDGSVQDDIAIVYFDGTLPDGYEVAQLADNDIEPSQDSVLTIAGYGLSNYKYNPSTNEGTGTGSGNLKKGYAYYSGKFNNGENFVLTWKNATVCKGDSGGPTFLKFGGVNYVYGIVYQADAECKFRGNYSSVQGKRNWIYNALINIYKVAESENDIKSFDTLGNIYKIGKGTPPTDLNNTYWNGRCFASSKPFEATPAGFRFGNGENARFYWAPAFDPNTYDGLLYREVENLLNTVPGHLSFTDSLTNISGLSLYQGRRTKMRFYNGKVVVEVTNPDDGQVMLRCLYSNLGIE